MFDVILYKDVVGGTFPPAIGNRPHKYRRVGKDQPEPDAPVLRMSQAELAERIADTADAWQSYVDEMAEDQPELAAVFLRSDNGTTWRVIATDAGKLDLVEVRR